MALVSISKAAKLAGCARSTIYEYINTGKLSATTDSYKNTKQIDTSELIRVFGKINNQKETTKKDSLIGQEIHNQTEFNTKRINDLEKENEVLKILLSEKEARIKDKDKHIESLDNAIRLLEDQRIKTQVLQTAQQEEPQKEEKKGFFQRLFRS